MLRLVLPVGDGDAMRKKIKYGEEVSLYFFLGGRTNDCDVSYKSNDENMFLLVVCGSAYIITVTIKYQER